MVSPYRSPPPNDGRCSDLESENDPLLRAVVLMLWGTSMVRAGGAFLRGETLTAEPTIAMAMVLVLPFLFREAFLPRWARLRKRR